MPSKTDHGPESFTVSFDGPVALEDALRGLDVEYLAVNETRFIALYVGEVIQLEVGATHGDAVARIDGRVLESPHSRTENWVEFTDRFIARLERAAAPPADPPDGGTSETNPP